MKFRELDLSGNFYISKDPKSVYVITCIDTNRHYVGSSANVYQRFVYHMNNLRLNHHPSKIMQKDYDKYGENSFRVKSLGLFDVNMARHIEYLMMCFYNTRNPEFGYNHNDKHGIRWESLFKEEIEELKYESKETGVPLDEIIINYSIKNEKSDF